VQTEALRVSNHGKQTLKKESKCGICMHGNVLMKPIIFVQFIYANKKLGERNQKAQFMQFKEMCVL
jgi:hypothetical protein